MVARAGSVVQERRDGRNELIGVVEPGVVASTWLDDEPGRGEQGGELGDHPLGPLRVQATCEQRRRTQCG